MTSIPLSIVQLLIGFFAQTPTEAQHDQLDEWMCESEANQRIFEQCLEVTLLPKRFDTDGQEFEFELTGSVHLN